jgi:hypothetical protein
LNHLYLPLSRKEFDVRTEKNIAAKFILYFIWGNYSLGYCHHLYKSHPVLTKIQRGKISYSKGSMEIGKFLIAYQNWRAENYVCIA